MICLDLAPVQSPELYNSHLQPQSGAIPEQITWSTSWRLLNRTKDDNAIVALSLIAKNENNSNA